MGPGWCGDARHSFFLSLSDTVSNSGIGMSAPHLFGGLFEPAQEEKRPRPPARTAEGQLVGSEQFDMDNAPEPPKLAFLNEGIDPRPDGLQRPRRIPKDRPRPPSGDLPYPPSGVIPTLDGEVSKSSTPVPAPQSSKKHQG